MIDQDETLNEKLSKSNLNTTFSNLLYFTCDLATKTTFADLIYNILA